MDIKKTLFTAFAYLFFLVSLVGQRVDNFPYSRFGVGQEVDLNNIANRGYGGLGSASLDYYNFNLVNPASLPFLSATTFDIGASAKNSTQKDPTTSNNFWSGNLDYMSLAFPLSNPINEAYEGLKKDHKFAMGLNLNRRSHVGYNIRSVDSLNEVGRFNRNYTGQGGTYQFGLSLGYKYKNFAIGTTASYVWGSSSFSRSIDYLDVSFPFNTEFSDNYFLRGFNLNTGIMYDLTLNKKEMEKNKGTLPKRLTFGARISTSTNFKTTSDIFTLSRQNITGFSQIVDTIAYQNNVSGSGKLPMEYSFGVIYSSQEKFGLGFDFRSIQWSEYFNTGNYEKINTLKDIYHVSFGGFYRPDYKSFNSFFKRVQYRYGAYYRQEPETVQNVRNTSRGITAGMNMPFVYQRKISHVNLSFDLGQTGKGTVISENFIKIGLGFNFNDDEWFLKRKYN
jgi:hypothetical protein